MALKTATHFRKILTTETPSWNSNAIDSSVWSVLESFTAGLESWSNYWSERMAKQTTAPNALLRSDDTMRDKWKTLSWGNLHHWCYINHHQWLIHQIVRLGIAHCFLVQHQGKTWNVTVTHHQSMSKGDLKFGRKQYSNDTAHILVTLGPWHYF